MHTTKNYIGGEWIRPSAGTISRMSPSDFREEAGVVYLSDSSAVTDATDAARRALAGWASLTGLKRGDILYEMADALRQHAEELAQLASLEMGKPIGEMRGEVTRGIQILRYYAAEGARAIGSVIPASTDSVLQYTRRVPLGVVGIITPWNFPVAIPMWKIAPALICANTVVWKPAEIASLTATKLVEILATTSLPKGVINLVIGQGRKIGDALLQEADLDGVSFTGSTATGQHVAATCASRNIKYQTEMGGKNAAVVLRDADLSITVPAILSGAFRSAGQKCTATSRIIVEDDIYDQLVAQLKATTEAIRQGAANDEQSYLGPVASKEQQEKVQSYVQMAQSADVIAAGAGTDLAHHGAYITPLIVSGVGVDHPLVQEEIFGPIATIVRAKDLADAISVCNRTVYGLTASVFTQDVSKAFRFLEEAEAGMVRVNLETAGVEYQAPFGGMKMSSSHSREQGQAALDFYSQIKTCAVYYGSNQK